MYTKVILGKNGSILGKIPIQTSESNPYPEVRPSKSSDYQPRRGADNFIEKNGELEDLASYCQETAFEMPREDRRDEVRPRRVLEASVELPESFVEALERLAESRNRRENRNDRERERRSDSPHRGSRSQQDDASRRNPHSSKEKSKLASLVQGYLDSTFLEDGNDSGRVNISENECFFPDPMITFLIDRPELVCTICQEKLEMAEMANDCSDSNLAILPCAHVACHRCLKTWFNENRKCPICREKLRHRDCGHTIKPTLITYDTITTLPKTIPRGGNIHHQCRKCEEKARKDKAVKMLKLAARGITNARHSVESLNIEGEHASLMMECVEDLFYRIPDEYAAGLRERRW
ncbi:hypothetical protein F5Y06DRAFT_308364 [Hypoxylon sp. FL0890]|nr:hypothetical protein F5Y06DRAFT_308364 [Hypoxylon sp. FL0890]